MCFWLLYSVDFDNLDHPSTMRNLSLQHPPPFVESSRSLGYPASTRRNVNSYLKLFQQIRGELPRARSTPWGHLGRLASEGGPSITLSFRSSSLATRDSKPLRFAEEADFLADFSPWAAEEPVEPLNEWIHLEDPEK